MVGPLTVWQFRGFCFRVLFLLCLLLLFRVIEVEFDIIPVCFYTKLAGLSSAGLHGVIDIFLLSSIVSLNSKAITFFN